MSVLLAANATIGGIQIIIDLVQKATWVANRVGALNSYTSSSSIAEVASVAQVQPFTFVGRDIINDEELPNILQTVQSIFTAYYMQAAALQGTVNKIAVLKILDTLNPNRNVSNIQLIKSLGDSMGGSAMSSLGLGKEDYEEDIPVLSPRHKPTGEALMSFECYKDNLPSSRTTGSEAMAVKYKPVYVETLSDPAAEEKPKPEPQIVGSQVSVGESKLIGGINDVTNLCVGKLVEIEITPEGIIEACEETDERGKKTVKKSRKQGPSLKVVVAIRLMVKQVDPELAKRIFVFAGKDHKLMSRYHQWTMGEIKFWRDVVLDQDYIDEYKKLRHADKTGIFNEIQRRALGNMRAGLATKTPSLNDAANIWVISSSNAAEIENALNGKFEDAEFRQRCFSKSYAMILVIFDKRWKRVSVYIRGNSVGTELSMADIKASSKGTGPDITAIFQALTAGGRPVL